MLDSDWKERFVLVGFLLFIHARANKANKDIALILFMDADISLFDFLPPEVIDVASSNRKRRYPFRKTH